MGVKTFEWPEEAVAMMREMAAERESLRETARAMSERFGRRLTASAVIGKASRLGIHFNSWSAKNTKGRPPKERPAKAIPSLSIIMDRRSEPVEPGPIAHVFAPVDEPAAVAIPETGRVTLLDLRESMCRWPMWRDDEPRQFCGERAATGAVYCGYHAQIAYTTPAEAKRKVAEWRKAQRQAARAS
jgi:GcrA cell cycle regulator